MYDELVKRLRELAAIPEHCENVANCDQCSKEDICLSFTNKRIIEVATQAADAIEELQRLAEANKTSRWIPVTERLPKFGKTVLAIDEDGEYLTPRLEKLWDGEVWVGARSVYDEQVPVTHWMPMPKAPRDGE